MYYLKKLCSICLGANKNLINKKDLNNDLVVYYEKLVGFAEKLPDKTKDFEYICDSCFPKLKTSCRFWLQCVKNRNILISYVYELALCSSDGEFKKKQLSVSLFRIRQKKKKKIQEYPVKEELVQEEIYIKTEFDETIPETIPLESLVKYNKHLNKNKRASNKTSENQNKSSDVQLSNITNEGVSTQNETEHHNVSIDTASQPYETRMVSNTNILSENNSRMDMNLSTEYILPDVSNVSTMEVSSACSTPFVLSSNENIQPVNVSSHNVSPPSCQTPFILPDVSTENVSTVRAPPMYQLEQLTKNVPSNFFPENVSTENVSTMKEQYCLSEVSTNNVSPIDNYVSENVSTLKMPTSYPEIRTVSPKNNCVSENVSTSATYHLTEVAQNVSTVNTTFKVTKPYHVSTRNVSPVDTSYRSPQRTSNVSEQYQNVSTESSIQPFGGLIDQIILESFSNQSTPNIPSPNVDVSTHNRKTVRNVSPELPQNASSNRTSKESTHNQPASTANISPHMLQQNQIVSTQNTRPPNGEVSTLNRNVSPNVFSQIQNVSTHNTQPVSTANTRNVSPNVFPQNQNVSTHNVQPVSTANTRNVSPNVFLQIQNVSTHNSQPASTANTRNVSTNVFPQIQNVSTHNVQPVSTANTRNVSPNVFLQIQNVSTHNSQAASTINKRNSSPSVFSQIQNVSTHNLVSTMNTRNVSTNVFPQIQNVLIHNSQPVSTVNTRNVSPNVFHQIQNVSTHNSPPISTANTRNVSPNVFSQIQNVSTHNISQPNSTINTRNVSPSVLPQNVSTQHSISQSTATTSRNISPVVLSQNTRSSTVKTINGPVSTASLKKEVDDDCMIVDPEEEKRESLKKVEEHFQRSLREMNKHKEIVRLLNAPTNVETAPNFFSESSSEAPPNLSAPPPYSHYSDQSPTHSNQTPPHSNIRPELFTFQFPDKKLDKEAEEAVRLMSNDYSMYCPKCDKYFSSQFSHRSHMQLHTGAKPHECQHCGRTFGLISYLRKHEKVHHGDKPFTCEFCDKAFTYVGHLNVHMRMHTGNKPYECAICNKRFSIRANYKSHQMIHLRKPGEFDENFRILQKKYLGEKYGETTEDHEAMVS